MNETERCPECGSWGEECAFPTAQPGCGCARCLRAQRDEARACLAFERVTVAELRAEVARFKDIARQRSEDYLAANVERVKAVERVNNPSMEVPCGHCGTKFMAEEFTCGDCMDEVDDKYFVEAMRQAASEQREACAKYAFCQACANEVSGAPLVTEGDK